MRSLPNTFILGAAKWDIFCTLTYADECTSVEGVTRHGLAWLEKLRVRMRMQETEWFWFLRPERGESGGRFHLHALLKVRPRYLTLFVVPKPFICAAHRYWGRGMTTFRYIEDQSDPAVLYLQKENTCGADTYENLKTAAASHGVPSLALLTRASLQESDGNVGRPTSARKHTGGKNLEVNQLASQSSGLRDRD